MKNFKQTIVRNLSGIPGWHTKRKILVIESDDWGSIRMSSKEAYDFFLRKGFEVDKCPYNTYDSLESNDDLDLLFEVLSSVKDRNGNSAVMTANTLVANPDFNKIRETGFREYYYETLPLTLKHYPRHNRVLELYKEGRERRIFYPQFHGREHLNISRWMQALQNNDYAAKMAFEQAMFSVHHKKDLLNKYQYTDALNASNRGELQKLHGILKDGIDLFESILGFGSKSFIAPCYLWHTDLEKTLSDCGVKYIQGNGIQKEPKLKNESGFRKKYHFTGQKNKHGQIYLRRNAFFEPSQNSSFDWIDDSLKRMETSFKWHKPVILSTHRLNFMASLVPENRSDNLKLFHQLLRKIVKTWPDVEFMTTVELGDLIDGERGTGNGEQGTGNGE